MPTISRPDGATIYYEVSGQGAPLLLLAPGVPVGGGSAAWRALPFNPLQELADGFTLIALEQRHSGRSPAPLTAFSYDQSAADQLAVLDAVGAERALVLGAGIGCVHAWRLIYAAPSRIAAAVCIEPVGLDGARTLAARFAQYDETTRLVRAEGLAAVTRAAVANGDFAANPGAGPFARRLHDDAAFRDEFCASTVERYAALMVRFRDGVWPHEPPFISVSQAWMSGCPAPLLVLPGQDALHSESVARRLCATAPHATCLDAGWDRSDKLPATGDLVRAFLRAYS